MNNSASNMNSYHSILFKVEQLLSAYVEERIRHNDNIDYSIIYKKALGFYHLFDDHPPIDSDKVLFEKICLKSWNRYCVSKSELTNIQNHDPRQVFFVHEANLYWKRLPYKNLTNSMSSLNTLLCCNAAGDFKMKLMVTQQATPVCPLMSASKISLASLPVIWKRTEGRCIMDQIFDEWFNYHFFPTVTAYLSGNNLPNEAVLIFVVNGHRPPYLNSLKANVKVIYISQIDDRVLCRTFEDGITNAFKAYYYARMLNEVIDTYESVNNMNAIIEINDNYTLLSALSNMAGAWDAVPKSYLNSLWAHVWPLCVSELIDTSAQIASIIDNIMYISSSLPLGRLTSDRVKSLLAFNRGFPQLCKHLLPEDTVSTLSHVKINNAILLINEGLEIFSYKDPDNKRSRAVQNAVNEALVCYKQFQPDH